MLPYGALWKLDEMMHPTAPRGRRTVAEKRRQAVFAFIFGVVVCSLFLIPYHVTHLRRLSISKEHEKLGFSVDPTVAEAVAKNRHERLERVTSMLDQIDVTTGSLDTAVATQLAHQWRRAFYYDERANPVPVNHLFRTEAYARQIEGLAYYNDLVPSLTGAWRAPNEGETTTAPTKSSVSPASYLAAASFWPVQSASPVTQAGCVRAIQLSKAAGDARTAMRALFAELVRTEAGWHDANLLEREPVPGVVVPPLVSGPAAWRRVALFLQALRLDASGFGHVTRVLSCEAAAEDVVRAGEGIDAHRFCVCACPGTAKTDQEWQFDLVEQEHNGKEDWPRCTDACSCG